MSIAPDLAVVHSVQIVEVMVMYVVEVVALQLRSFEELLIFHVWGEGWSIERFGLSRKKKKKNEEKKKEKYENGQ